MKKIIEVFLIMVVPVCYAGHIQNEKYYQKIWCRENKGITEYILPDKTRVDCLTKNYAVEFDFASKWAESVGQSLYYAKMTSKKPAIVLIMESNDDEKYYNRAELLAKNYNITLFKMKSDNYNNYYKSQDIITEFMNYIKNWIKLILINIIDSL